MPSEWDAEAMVRDTVRMAMEWMSDRSRAEWTWMRLRTRLCVSSSTRFLTRCHCTRRGGGLPSESHTTCSKQQAST